MRLAEELILLLLNEDSGYLEQIPSWNLSCVFAGAILADLALENRLDTDLESLILLDKNETGDELLDPVLSEIASESSTRNAQYWVEKIAPRSESIVESVLERLVEKEILDYDAGGFWSLSRKVTRTGTYPSLDGVVRAEVRARILRVILDNEIPDPRDVILISLVHTCDALRLLMPVEEYEEAQDRIELVCKMDLIGRAIATAVTGISLRPPPMRFVRKKTIPKLGVRHLFKNLRAIRHLRNGNLPRAMAELYRAYGPVIEIDIPFVEQQFILLIGHEANSWVNKRGRAYLRTKDYIWHMENVFGASRTLPGMDGAEHFRMRKSLRRGYARATLENRLDEVYSDGRTAMAEWKPGDVLDGTFACQTLAGRQLSHLFLAVDSADYLPDILEYQHRTFAVRIQKVLPEFMLHTPSMKRKRARLFEFVGKVQSAHTLGIRGDQPPDLIDDLLTIHRDDPQYLPETDLPFYFVAALFTGNYLGSVLAFLLCTLASHPELHERVKAEADALFKNGNPLPSDFSLDAIDTTHRVYLETLRLFPAIVAHIRNVMNPFEFQGYEIPLHARLLIPQTAAHFLEENFAEPLKFDIDRYLPGREEHMKLGAYAPFGLGTHKCLGSRWVDLQVVVDALMIAHHFDFKVAPSCYELGIGLFPTSAPDKHFKIHIEGMRNELPTLTAR